MPMWHIYTHEATYSDDDKKAMADVITDLYEEVAGLPRFYVIVVFHDQQPGTLFIGGRRAEKFVRIWMDHAARNADDAGLARWLREVDKRLKPFVQDRGLHCEIHGDEVPRAFWTIDGMIPPPTASDDELRWKKDNAPSPLTTV